MKLPAISVTDLSNCDREPIHAPGSIQPHGFLFVVEPGPWIVSGASSNVRDFFWREASALIGSKIEDALGAEIVPDLERVCAHPEIASRVLLVKTLPLEIDGKTQDFTLVAHLSGANLILEGERATDLSPLAMETQLQTFLGRLSSTESLEELYRLAVAEVRRLTGFDRCLLYQFDADWNGAVIAEDRNQALPTYLHQRFPASDIPAQARELYRRNRVRLIPSHTYRPAPISMRSGSAPASSLDLGLSVLRGVSPIHLEYMRNMGTGSSMSVAVLRGTELWGLISCHSRESRWIPFATRAACDLLGQFFSLQITARENARQLTRRLELTRLLTRLVRSLARAENPLDGEHSDELLQLAGASGVALIREKGVVLRGQTPSPSEVAELAEWVAGKQRPILFWDALGNDYVPAQNFAGVASGLLVVSLQETPFAAILWFRPEFIRVIEWGGEPRKAIEAHGEGRTLHPRKSFEIWRETLRGHSKAWEPEVISLANEFRETMRDILIPSRKENS